MEKVDIVVPVMNEAASLNELVRRIDKSFNNTGLAYNIIIIDDHSTDSTKTTVSKLAYRYPIKYFLKKGKKGKAFSILEGADYSDSEYVAMLDGDLQYPPEFIPQMIIKAKKENLGVVIGERTHTNVNWLRKFVSTAGKLVYAKLILGFNTDTQSGLKLFKRELIEHLNIKDVRPWAFDLPLLYTARELGEKIGGVNIDFEKRKKGHSKINLLITTWQILTTAIKLKMRSSQVFHLAPNNQDSMIGAGVVYKRKKFVTHTTLHSSKSAIVTFTNTQKFVIFTVFLALIAGLIINAKLTAITFIAILSAIYFADVLFGLYLVLKSLHNPPEISFKEAQLKRIKDNYLPVYSILCPLYKEAHVLPQFVANIQNLDWPKEKLDVILLLEEDDTETINEARRMSLPEYFRILVVPDGHPKTKPKACNYGLSHAKGEYVVIFDAEDAPEPLQLKKAYLGFANVNPDVFCLQAKLNYYNPNQNLLTKLFTAEYSLWFDVVLPGLQTIETTIPLGGTSNHFRVSDLKKLEGWDPFNVAEDADLGARLFRQGYKTAIIDSLTLEEANPNIKNWIRQRSRWIKGYLQTYFVQMRSPLKFVREQKHHYFIFQLVNGLRVGFMIINPFLWAMTASYFLLYKFVGPQIESLYPAPVFYMAVFSAVFGNFLYVYYYMIGAAKRGQWGIIKYVFLVPFYWLLTSIGAFVAFYQLIFKPHYWEKTIHGLAKAERNEVEKNLGIPVFGLVKKYASAQNASALALIISVLFGNFFGFLYNAYLGRRLSLEDFGLITLFGSFVYITQIFTSALGRSFTHKSAFLLGKYGAPVMEMWEHYRKIMIKLSIIASVAWILSSPLLAGIFKANGVLPFLIYAPVIIIGIVGSVDSGVLSGSLKFWVISFLNIIEPAVKFILTVFFVEIHHTNLVYTTIPLSMFTSFLLAFYFVKRIKGADKTKTDTGVVLSFPKKFFATSILAKTSTIVFLSLDLVAAKIFLNPTIAGEYAIISTVGKMVFFLSTIFNQFIIPFASKDNGEENNSGKSFITIFSLTALSTLFGVLVFGILGRFSAPILMGSKALPILEYLPIFCIGIAFHSISTSLVSYYQAKKRYEFPAAELIFSSFGIIGLLFFHADLMQFSIMMFIGGSLDLAGVLLLHIFYSQYKSVTRNLIDFTSLFKRQPFTKYAYNKNRLRILVFNWRDTRHTWSGGAEVYIHELALRWVKMGHRVTVFCGNDGKSPRNEVIDGVQIVRRGGFYTVYVWAFLYYILRFRGLFDVIIDSENGIPFFTPLYARAKIFLLIHHVHQEVFRIKLKPPFSYIGRLLEKRVMPTVYKNTEVVTVSPSSKADILEHELTKKDPVVIYNGVDINKYKPGIKAVNPMVLYLGRLSKQKTLSIFIHAAKEILAKIPTVEFVIAGEGVDKKNLIKLAKNIGLTEKIKFLGRVEEEEKIKLYQNAWVFVNPSLIEGWGITTIEANACATPVVASNVAGLRDSVKNPHSGILVPYGNVDEFAKAVTRLLTNKKMLRRMSRESVTWAKKFEWSKSARDFINIV